jgi:hypothetical protein
LALMLLLIAKGLGDVFGLRVFQKVKKLGCKEARESGNLGVSMNSIHEKVIEKVTERERERD